MIINQTETILRTINSSVTEQLDHFLKDHSALVERMASNQKIKSFLETVESRDEIKFSPLYEEINDYLNQIHQTYSDISNVWIASEAGSYFISNYNTVSLPDYDIKSRPWYTHAMSSSRSISFSEPYDDIVTGKKEMTIVKKVTSQDKLIGFTSISMYVDILPGIMSKYRVGETGYSFLLTKRGTILYHPDQDLIMKSWSDIYGSSALNEIQEGLSLVDISGRQQYVVAAPVPKTGWIAGTALPKSEAMAQLTSFSRMFLLVQIGAGIMLVILVSLLLNYMLKNIPLIIRQLHLVAEGRLSNVVAIDSRDELGQIAGAINKMSHKLHSSMKMFHESSYYDPLTALPNRRFLSEKLASALQESGQRNESLVLFFIDLDNFKLINDTRGHKFGDELLRQVGSRLMLNHREDLMVFRFGGDEFVIILEHVQDEQEVHHYAQRLRQAFSAPFEFDRQKFDVNYSAGIAMFPQDGESEEELLKNADLAMYRAKSLGKNTVQYFNSSLTSSLIEKEQLTHALREAVSDCSFAIHYQPLIDLKGNRIYGFEALIRWTHSEMGAISPEQFIPLTEELGFIEQVGEWVLHEACQVCRQLQAKGDVSMSVNVSGYQLRSPQLIDSVKKAIRQSGIKPHLLVLEITESTVIECFEQSIDTLQKLRALGVRLALDDFGTGYSSFSYLKNLPVDILKIDKMFIQDLDNDTERGTNIVGSLIQLVHNLEMKVTAEGVETAEQAELLKAWNCDIAQGYLYSKPLPADQIGHLWNKLDN
ncbi:EAL domain-containing protein [Paenibacillus tarimensis]